MVLLPTTSTMPSVSGLHFPAVLARHPTAGSLADTGRLAAARRGAFWDL